MEKSIMRTLQGYNYFKKIPEDLAISTMPGVILSFVGTFIMIALLVLELQDYWTVEYTTDMVIDENVDDTIRLNFNITLYDVPCEFTSVDVLDMTGQDKHNITRNILRTRLAGSGQTLGIMLLAKDHQEEEPEEEKHEETPLAEINEEDLKHVINLSKDLFEGELNQHDLTFVNFFAPWCIWCQRLEPTWINTAKELPDLHFGQHVRIASVDCVANAAFCREHHIRAFPTLRLFERGNKDYFENYMGQRSTQALLQFIEQKMHVYQGRHPEAGSQTKQAATVQRHHDEVRGKMKTGKVSHGPEGCNIAGFLNLNKVPGNFMLHLTHPQYDIDKSLINSSHVINELWFGEHLSQTQQKRLPPAHMWELKSPTSHRLDGVDFITSGENQTYVHYLKVVTKMMQGRRSDSPTHVYKYTAHTHHHKETDDDVPAVMFKYDLSPISVVVMPKRKPLYHFVTNTCAIVGGVLTVVGLVNSLLNAALETVSKKII